MQALLLSALMLVVRLLLQARIGVCQELPIFIVHPQGMLPSSGEAVALKCTTDNSSDTIQWKHNEEIEIGASAGTLAFDSFSDDDEGYYACVATRTTQSGSFTISSAEAHVRIPFLTTEYNKGEGEVGVDPGDHRKLPCIPDYDSLPKPRFTWYYEVVPGLFEAGISATNLAITGPDGSAVLRNVSEVQKYRCEVDNDESGESVQYTTNVVLSDNPVTDSSVSMVVSPQDALVNLEDSLVLYCIATNEQDVTWNLNGKEIVNSGNFFIHGETTRLLIKQVNSTSAGVYTCDHPTLGQFNATVSVRNPPSILSPPQPSITVNYGSPLTLNCSTKEMVLKYRWYLNGTLLADDNDVLQDDSVTYASTGTYQCYAYNEAGNDSFATFVNIHAEPPVIPSLPPSKLAGFAGSSLNISCEASGIPPPTYSWSLNGVTVEESDGRGTLFIDILSSSDTGNYKCEANNGIGSPAIASTTVSIIDPTVIVVDPLTVVAHHGQSFSLECNEMHDMTATVELEWIFGGEIVEDADNRAVTHSQGSVVLEILNAQYEDAGEYICEGTTSSSNYTVGSPQAKNISSVTVTQSPVSPELTDVTALNSTAITLSWIYAGVLDNLMRFIVERKQASDSEDKWVEEDDTPMPKAITRHNITGLEAYTEYLVRVGAEEVNGVVTYDNEMGTLITTLEDVPDQPTEVSAIGLEDGISISVSWKALEPPSSNGLITAYTVRYFLSNVSSSERSQLTKGDATMHNISNLTPDTEYTIDVAGHTSVGMGPFSERVRVRTMSEAVSSTSLTDKVWFIALMVLIAIVLILSMGLVIIVAYWRRARGGKYPVSHSVQLSCDGSEPMTEDTIMDYEHRKKDVLAQTAFDGADSEIDGSAVTLPTTISSLAHSNFRMNVVAPPSYINPPSFEETLRAKSHSMSVIDRPSGHRRYESGWSMGHEKLDQYDEESVNKQVILGAESGSSEDSGVISQSQTASVNNCATFV